MVATRSFLVLDINGAPLTSATPTFVDYRDTTGTSRTPPSNPTHVGGGLYAYTPSASDETTGTVALVDAGSSAYPRYVTESIHLATNANQFWAYHVEDQAGALWTGTAPTVGDYRDRLGASRTPPTATVVSGAYLFALTPTAGDVTAETIARIDMPTGAYVAHLKAETMPLVAGSTTINNVGSIGNSPELVAIAALMAYLRLYLPPKVAEINALRAAVLQTPGVGTGNNVGWLISSGMTLLLTSVSRDDAGTLVTLPTGAAVTALEIATAINAVPVTGILASADETGRLVLTSTTAPTSGASFVGVKADSTGGNAALGFDPGGEHVMTSPIRAPTHRGVRDGYPTTAPDLGQGFWVVIGDRDARPYPSPGQDIRRGTCAVHFVVELFKPEANLNAGKSREAITSCLRAVREVLQTDEGRYLGHASTVTRVDIGVTRISGRSFSFTNDKSPNVICDVAALEVTVHVFQRTLGA